MEFSELQAHAVAKPRKLSQWAESGSVGAAILTQNGNIYVGVCIDTACSMGFCAEHAAAASMITNGENIITKVIAVNSEGTIFPPCGRCREFLSQ
ncbi:cytidine deaminase family protein [Bacillus ndiopicus]|uniref:cytidine deaminase family protein n=1 Tax=Bacillus ndiopicus TaxID=1347368 RepID=UPI0005A99B5F|nr:cytidine deaminase [Bacillus ndiopicus]